MDPNTARFPAVVYALAAVPAIVMACVAVALPRSLATEPIALVRRVSPMGDSSNATRSNSINATTISSTITSGPSTALNITLSWQGTSVVGNKTAFNWPIDIDPLLSDGSFALANLGFSYGLFEVCAYYSLINVTQSKSGRGRGDSWGGGGPTPLNQTCVTVSTYCSQGRISSGSCAGVKAAQVASVSHILFHVSGLAALWFGVSMVAAAAGSRAVRAGNGRRKEVAGGSRRWLITMRDKYHDRANLQRTGGRVLLASFLLQAVAELLAVLSLVLESALFSQDPFFSTTDPNTRLLEEGSRSYHQSSLGVSAQLLIVSLCLNTLMSVITFFRYKSAIFPSSKAKHGDKTNAMQMHRRTSGDIEQDDSADRNSLDSGYSNTEDNRDHPLYNDRFEAWTRSVTLANTNTQPIHQHALSKNDAMSIMQPSIIHETKSNHSGGSVYHHHLHQQTTATSLGSPSTSVPVSLPSLVHETKSNHSGSVYNMSGSFSFTPIPAQSITPRTSATLDDSNAAASSLVHRRGRRKSGSTPPVIAVLPKFPLPGHPGVVGVTAGATGAIMAVVPPRDAEWDDIDMQLLGAGAGDYRGVNVEYIEMKPAVVGGGGGGGSGENGSLKSAPIMMGTVVFDDD
ncbi:hypothetical protein BJ741DRAFT_602280 [Chytriomyces cf. hyalinus JEL632]|nr:hypothetical protein BJ741DRAFT_602280 [Chytriomyces cf. hyalinus JEL632]